MLRLRRLAVLPWIVHILLLRCREIGTPRIRRVNRAGSSWMGGLLAGPHLAVSRLVRVLRGVHGIVSGAQGRLTWKMLSGVI